MGVRARVMKGFSVLLLVIAFWALPSKAMASPIACGGGADVTTYTDGCFVDGLLFSQFSVINAGSSTVLVNAVLASVVGNTVFFTFNPISTVNSPGNVMSTKSPTRGGGSGMRPRRSSRAIRPLSTALRS